MFLTFGARISMSTPTIIWTNVGLLITPQGTNLYGILKEITNSFCRHSFQKVVCRKTSIFVETQYATLFSQIIIRPTVHDLVCKTTRWASSGCCNRIWDQALLTRWGKIYIISQEICTRVCCALLCCGYAIVHNEFTSGIYPYSSGLLCWHWGNR